MEYRVDEKTGAIIFTGSSSLSLETRIEELEEKYELLEEKIIKMNKNMKKSGVNNEKI